ncbi:MAG: phosphoribosylanthranilate isomerase [Candidatus Puniceispirillales bacterium]
MADVKICGIRTAEDYAVASNAGARWVGMVFFARSPRSLSLEEAAELRDQAPQDGADRVALVVDADDQSLAAIIAAARPQMLQCHGSETPARLAEIKANHGLPVMKAIRVEDRGSLEDALAYDAVADWMLFDSAPQDASLPGGTGHRFDWGLMQQWQGQKPWMLAGGLSADNVAEAITISGARAVDVSSKVEQTPGNKDHAAIQAFVSAAVWAT